ncbi:MAG: deoxyribose-phosphate aldolase [Armatimonadota bacterium]|nr:deoxyribose-phosphate aldolase [Armatimonadota bacterium]
MLHFTSACAKIQVKMNRLELAKRIDHTLLRPTGTYADVVRLCEEALQYRFASVCVQPCWVELAARQLAGSDVAVGTVVGFPLGANMPSVKLYEAEQALAAGATELDMVIALPALKSGDWRAVRHEIEQIACLCRSAQPPAVLKVIIECCYLTQEEKIRATHVVAEAGADFVKTSTGFGEGGATIEDVRLLRAAAPSHLKVKAAGGIRTLSLALELLQAGADRLGTSSGVALLQQLEEEG